MKRKISWAEKRRRETARLHWAIVNKINHFSPTISPSPKNDVDIESIKAALNYYKSKGIESCVIQPKFMGSYCDVYLYPELEDTMFVSRNGYKINHIDRDKLLSAIKSTHRKFNWKQYKQVIVQTELMPWRALGSRLIDIDFGGYLQSHKDHSQFLSNTSIYSKIEKIKNSQEFKDFYQDYVTSLKSELKEKYAPHIIRQYKTIINSILPDPVEYAKDIEIYKHQLNLFNNDLVNAMNNETYFEFRPFNILRKIKQNDTMEFPEDNALNFMVLNPSGEYYCKIVDLNDPFYEFAGDSMWEDLVHKQEMEGVVVKPIKVYNEDIAPMLKVRNKNYLQLIYGVNFNKDYSYYLERRRIDWKVKCSINEWEIAQQLLRIHPDEIKKENQAYIKLFQARIRQERIEEKLDTRL